MKKACAVLAFLLLPGCANFPRATHAPAAPGNVYRGVYHVHTEFSKDSRVSLQQALAAGRKAALDFVVITDHNNRNAAAAYQSRPNKEGPLLIIGEEISTPDGHLIALGTGEAAPKGKSTEELMDWIHARGGYAMLAHPVGKRSAWQRLDLKGYDGMEIYNFGHRLYALNRAATGAAFGFLHTSAFLKRALDRPDDSLAAWDAQLRKRPVAAAGAADAHVHFRMLGLPSESLLMMFQAVTLNVLADAPDERKIVDAIGKGRSFISFDTRGLARDFRFYAEAGGKIYQMGDRAAAGIKTFHINAPGTAEIRLLKDGDLFAGSTGPGIEVDTADAGVYRVEVTKDGKPWIFSNPIYAD
ncbi:MAG TPA: CehA/McbA family metallohydrolase [Verrucomicrobiae bacterium]|jgi:hypothetical protein|nr:CehA/McbA family metallohydrolase [Verrucomicrobiae bacterium]